MQTAFITLAYKQVFDADHKNAFEQQVWQSSYKEYLLKSQTYNTEGKFKTFTELKRHDGRANSLHYKSGFAVDGFLSTLNKQIPGLQTNLHEPISFSSYQFEVIESDITNIQAHKVAIIYFTGTLVLHEVIGNYLLLSSVNNKSEPDKTASTFMVQLQPLLSINNYESV